MREIDTPSAFFTDRRVARLSVRDRLIFLSLMALADEKGRIDCGHIVISRKLWGGSITPAGVEDAIEAIHGAGLVELADVAPEAVFPRPVIQINDWPYWQPRLAEEAS